MPLSKSHFPKTGLSVGVLSARFMAFIFKKREWEHPPSQFFENASVNGFPPATWNIFSMEKTT
jgi:hypothetical protein